MPLVIEDGRPELPRKPPELGFDAIEHRPEPPEARVVRRHLRGEIVKRDMQRGQELTGLVVELVRDA